MDSPSDPIQAPPPEPELERLTRPARAGLLAAALLLVGWVAAHALVDRPAIRARVQARALHQLQARLGPVELAELAEIDWAFRVWLGPLRLPAGAGAAEPLLTVERIRIRASLLAALAGRAEPASIRLYGVRLAPGERGQALEAALERWRSRRPPPGGATTPAPPDRSSDPVIQVRDLTITVPWRGRTIVLGPANARLERRRGPDEERVDAEAWLPGGGQVVATLRRRGGERGWAYQATARLDVADLPAFTRASGVRAEAGVLKLEVDGSTDAAGAKATLRGELSRLRLRGERLGPEAIGPLRVRGRAEVAWDRAARRLELRHGQLEPLGPLRLDVEGGLSLGPTPSFTLDVSLPPVDYRALVAALPPALAPPPGAPRPPGSLAGSLRLSGPLTLLVGWTVRAALDLSPMRAAVRAAPPGPLLSPLVARPDGEDGAAVQLGPASPTWIPVAELPEHVVRAITTSEDAGFFGHQGFDFAELLDALSAGAQAGRVVRGGSTISQQLAKNLYLSRDRTLVRKVREALVTIALEASLPKARLLELYLNLIEWGPGLHGIGAASRTYFGVDARQLTPRQACFLAAIIPSPARSHRLVAAGLADRTTRDRVDDLLLRLNGFGVITDEALERGLEEPLPFAFGAPPEPLPAPLPGAL